MEEWQVGLIGAIGALVGALIGGGISYLTNLQRLNREDRRAWSRDVVDLVNEIWMGVEAEVKPYLEDPDTSPLMLGDDFAERAESKIFRLSLIASPELTTAAHSFYRGGWNLAHSDQGSKRNAREAYLNRLSLFLVMSRSEMRLLSSRRHRAQVARLKAEGDKLHEEWLEILDEKYK